MIEQMGLELLASMLDGHRVFLELFVKTFAWLGGGLFVVSVIRRLSSAERHLILAAVLISQLALPWASLLMPRIELPLAWSAGTGLEYLDSANDPARSGQPTVPQRRNIGVNPPGEIPGPSGLTTSAGSIPPNSWAWLTTGLAMAYGLVALGLLAHFSICAWRVNRRIRSLMPSQDVDALALLETLRSELRISRSVTLKTSESGFSPWVWGIARPVVVLPREFEDWPANHRRDALVHELSHIARHDLLISSVARLCAVLYWFQPLAWFALRRMIREAESACDDRVLLNGTSNTSYARQLLEIANQIKSTNVMRTGQSIAPAMTGSSIVGKRIRSILGKETRRTIVNRYTTTAAVAASATLIVLLSTLTTSESQEAPQSPNGPSEAELQAIVRDGPQTSDDLEQLVKAYLSDGRQAEAASAFADYIARPNADRPICDFCTSLLPTDNTPRRTNVNAALRSAFETLEERAYASQDGDLLFRIANVLIDSTNRDAASRGTWYLLEALRLGNMQDVDSAKMLAVRALVQLGRLEAARSLVGEIYDDPASSYYQSESMRGWIGYLDQEIGRASALSALLLAMDEPEIPQDQDYLPVFKRTPIFPQTAADQRKEGNVVVEFTVNDRGKTENVRVVESSDPVFEGAALDAAANFLYMPKIVSGVAVNTPGVKNKITFEIGPSG